MPSFGFPTALCAPPMSAPDLSVLARPYAVVILISLEHTSGKQLLAPRVRWGFGRGNPVNDKGCCLDPRCLWTPTMYAALRSACADADEAVVRMQAWASHALMTFMILAIAEDRIAKIDCPDWVRRFAGGMADCVLDERLPVNHASWCA